MGKVLAFAKKWRWIIAEILIILVGIICDLSCDFTSIDTNRIETVIGHLFDYLPIVFGFAITCYLLFVELYKDRYPYTFIRNKALPQIKRDLLGIGIDLLFGMVVVAFEGGIGKYLAFVISAIIACAVTIIDVIRVSKTMTISSYVKDYCVQLTKDLEKSESIIEVTAYNQLKRVMEECIIKEEYLAAKQISDSSGKVFRRFLDKSIGLIEKGESSESIEKTFEDIVEFGMSQLKMCDDIDSELLVGDIKWQQLENLRFCVKANQYEWFTAYIEKLSETFYLIGEKRKQKTNINIFNIIISIFMELLEKGKNDWSRMLVEKVTDSALSIRNLANDDCFAEKVVTFIVIGLVENKDESLDELLFSKLKRFTFIINHYSRPKREYISVYHYYFARLIDGDETEKIHRFMEMIFQNVYKNNCDSAWIEFKIYCIDKLVDLKMEAEKIDFYRMKLLNQIIEMKQSYSGPVCFPDYKERLLKNTCSSEDIKKVCEDIESLFNTSIWVENVEFFYCLLAEWQECLSDSQKKDKDIQESMFEVYIWLANRTRYTTNKQFAEITFESMGEALEKLDSNKAISDGFGNTIVEKITELARRVDSEANTVLFRSIDFLSEFANRKELYRFVDTKEKKKVVGKGLYNIAVNCIENDYEEGLRKASNALGWFIINSIDNGISEVVKYLLMLSSHMYNLALEMNVSQKTLTFITTLFTTVGMYCCSNSSNEIYLRYTINNMQKISQEQVDAAIEMRIFENDTFSSVFKWDASKCSAKFKKTFNEMRSKK